MFRKLNLWLLSKRQVYLAGKRGKANRDGNRAALDYYEQEYQENDVHRVHEINLARRARRAGL